MPRSLREFAPLVLASVLAGVLAAALDPILVAVLFTPLALAVVGVLVRFRRGWSSAQRYPVATLLVGVAVLSVAWSGVRGVAALPISDLPLLAALPLVLLAALRRKRVLPVPGWLICV